MLVTGVQKHTPDKFVFPGLLLKLIQCTGLVSDGRCRSRYRFAGLRVRRRGLQKPVAKFQFIFVLESGQIHVLGSEPEWSSLDQGDTQHLDLELQVFLMSTQFIFRKPEEWKSAVCGVCLFRRLVACA